MADTVEASNMVMDPEEVETPPAPEPSPASDPNEAEEPIKSKKRTLTKKEKSVRDKALRTQSKGVLEEQLEGLKSRNKGTKISKKAKKLLNTPSKEKRKKKREETEEEAEKKKRRWHPGTVAGREVKKLQKSTNLLIPRAAFQRVVREVAQEFRPDMRFKKDALAGLQESAETLLTSTFTAMHILSGYRKVMTLNVRQLDALRMLKRSNPDLLHALPDVTDEAEGTLIREINQLVEEHGEKAKEIVRAELDDRLDRKAGLFTALQKLRLLKTK